MSDNAKKWYVVRTAGGKEKKVKEYIEKEIESHHLQGLVGQVLIPTEKYYQIKNGKRVSAERLFFPGYVLIECALTNELEHIIKNLSFVAGFLSESATGKQGDKKPVPLRESELNRILGRVDELADQDEETVTPFVKGEAVKIIDGPFNGFEGTVEEILDDKRKLGVSVKIFGRKTIMELNFAQVTKE
ncbi:MAG: transcription termination/antitermination factor NusG [Bacteroidaceae bacterium]|nr:transcription termination/antitermination factor NusG [Bacteroidaceae bacterium]